ncbi:MAG: EF-P lysine aminoacylase GenX [Bdellovibrionales bacterium GWB1_55_8]|nr:MAG: EF-P lysine aminoacylase GenX [Bdellovibrionales bacterium GWB1_55_8]
MKWMQQVLDPRRIQAMKTRAKLEAETHSFFNSRGFLATRTPLVVPSPGMEPHIRPFRVTTATGPEPELAGFLPTSPEFAMKRLLVGGLERVYQLSPAFRHEPRSTTHHREFTMLEWYRAYAGYTDIMKDTEELFSTLALRLFGEARLKFQGQNISVATPWPRLKVRDLFTSLAGVDLVKSSQTEDLAQECLRLGLKPAPTDTWDDLYFRIWLNIVEPALPADRAVFVVDYPASQSALAVVAADPDGSHWARRFEVYAGGLELGNAFEELTDPVEQRTRFAEDMELRARVYGNDFPATPMDEEFLGALEEGLPPSGGIAVGFDRLVMLFADEPQIDYTFWLP